MYPIIGHLGFLVIVIVVQVLGKYMTIGYLDPYGKLHDRANWSCCMAHTSGTT